MFLDNKYTKYYYQIVEEAKSRSKLDSYTERHHIIPRSLGGPDTADNLVYLTAREHFLCHWLLTKMVSGSHAKWKMVNALGLMTWAENNAQERYKISPRLYEQIKAKHSLLKSIQQRGAKNHFYGKKHTEESKKKMSEAKLGNIPWNKGKEFKGAGMTGKNHTEETRARIREAKKGTALSDEHKQKISKSLLAQNLTRSDETKEKMRQAKLGIKHPTKVCENCGNEYTIAMYTRWHGPKCRHRLGQ